MINNQEWMHILLSCISSFICVFAIFYFGSISIKYPICILTRFNHNLLVEFDIKAITSEADMIKQFPIIYIILYFDKLLKVPNLWIELNCYIITSLKNTLLKLKLFHKSFSNELFSFYINEMTLHYTWSTNIIYFRF